ncbi:hypothetical protein Bbelb_213800 [Branchiostoma belcheri]|nr:hypothetical protein Bbelb_213800 [Branchiostoma belcheri]
MAVDTHMAKACCLATVGSAWRLGIRNNICLDLLENPVDVPVVTTSCHVVTRSFSCRLTEPRRADTGVSMGPHRRANPAQPGPHRRANPANPHTPAVRTVPKRR